MSAVIWGFFAFPLRNLKEYPAEHILYFRVITAFVVVWLLILIFRKKQLKLDFDYFTNNSKEIKKLLITQILSSTIFLMLNWFTFIHAINHVSIKSGAFAYMVCPLITAFGGYLYLKEKLSKLQFFSLAIALISIIALAKGSFEDVIWSAIIATFYAFFLILQRKMKGLDKLNVMAVQLTIATLIMLPLFFFKHIETPSSTYFWGNILTIGILFTVIPLFLNMYALVGIPSSTMGIIIYINPIIAFTVAFLFFGEQVNFYQILSYSLLLFAVFLFNWQMIKDMFNFRRK